MSSPLLTLLKKKNIIKYGDFTLRSGKKSTYYCNVKEAYGDPKLLQAIVAELVKLVPKNATCIAGLGYGGITLATLVALRKKLPLVLVRDKVKDYGTKKSVDGYVPVRGDYICIVDDVFTTGSTVRDTKEKLKQTSAKFTTPLVLINRSRKKVLCVFSDRDIRI